MVKVRGLDVEETKSALVKIKGKKEEQLLYRKGNLRSIQIYVPEWHRTTVFYRPSEGEDFTAYMVFHST